MAQVLTRRNLLLGAAAAVAAPGIAGSIIAPTGVEIDTSRHDSLWTKELPPLPHLPKFEGEQKADLVIVGAGYTGLACAYYVKTMKPDWRVVVLESHRIGSGASSRNSGAVYASHVGVPDQEFSDRGLDRFRNFLETENIDCDFRTSPTLMLSTDGDTQTATNNLKSGEKWVSHDELKERGATSYYSGAVDSPNFFSIHPAKLFQGHFNAAQRLGVEVYENSAVLEVEKSSPALVKLSRGTIQASHVFIATNGYTPRLGIQDHNIFPVHQYSLATRQLSTDEIAALGLDRWSLRFEKSTLPVTFSLTPSGHFFVRMVIGYASFNSGNWADLAGAKALATRVFLQRYPMVADLSPDFGWHGVTGHTALSRPLFETQGSGNIHISAAYNGLGIMPGHNSGYLTACKITGKQDHDVTILSDASSHVPLPGELYRSIMFKPFMAAATPA